MPKGFPKGDPRAIAAARKGGEASRLTRRAQMWAVYAACVRGTEPFEAFLAGWRAHRHWSSQRRAQLKAALMRNTQTDDKHA